MDVWTYFHQKEREFSDLSLATDPELGSLFTEEEGSNGKRGRIFGHVMLTDEAYMQVHEVVVVVNDHVTREEYGYFLILDGDELWGYERDPSHDPPVHRHTRGHASEPCEAISFKDCVELAWADVTRFHEHRI
jgi:hypothetical protein